MASVHAVVHTKFGKKAAIKIAHRSIIGDHLSTDTFLREARIVHTVDHPAVIDVFATGTCEGRPYLVMERLAGRTLGHVFDHGPPLARKQAIGYLLELCDVLRAAHDSGVVHRDLKLDNVFITDKPFADGRHVKLLDWGVAHVAGEDDPFRGLIAGTLTYVAPEQIRGDALTPAADVYSLAVLAYTLLCRRTPFAAQNDLSLIHMHLRAEPPHPSIAWPEIPVGLEHLLLRMLAKTPEERPDLEEVEDILRACVSLVDAPASTRFADGSSAAIPLAANGPWYLRWLMVRRVAPEMAHDPLGRAVLPAPPFRVGWAALALAVTAAASLIAAVS